MYGDEPVDSEDVRGLENHFPDKCSNTGESILSCSRHSGVRCIHVAGGVVRDIVTMLSEARAVVARQIRYIQNWVFMTSLTCLSVNQSVAGICFRCSLNIVNIVKMYLPLTARCRTGQRADGQQRRRCEVLTFC